MIQIQKIQKKNSQLVSLTFVGVLMAAMIAYVVIYVTPVLGEFPVEITEELEILAVLFLDFLYLYHTCLITLGEKR